MKISIKNKRAISIVREISSFSSEEEEIEFSKFLEEYSTSQEFEIKIVSMAHAAFNSLGGKNDKD